MQQINTVKKSNELYQDLPIINRVCQLMDEVELDSSNTNLVLDIAVIYVQAQKDQIESQLGGKQ